MPRVFGRLIPFVLVVAVITHGCGDAATPATTAPADATAPPLTAPATAVELPPPEVEIRNGVVHPSSLDLMSRDTGAVVFTNSDDEQRVVASCDDEFAPFAVPPGASVEFDFAALEPGVHRFFVAVGNARNPGLVDTSALGQAPAAELIRSWDGRVGLQAATDAGDWEFLGLARGIIGGERTGWIGLQVGLLTGDAVANVENRQGGFVVTWEDGGADPAATGEARLAADALPEGCAPGESSDATIGPLAGREEEHECGIATLLRGFVADPAGPVVHYRMLAFDDDDRAVMREARATLHLDPGPATVTLPEPLTALGHPLIPQAIGLPDPADHRNADVRLTLVDGWGFTHLALGPWHSGRVTIVNEDHVDYEVLSPEGPVGTAVAGGELQMAVAGDGWYTLVGEDLRLVPLFLDPRRRAVGDQLVRTEIDEGVSVMHLPTPSFDDTVTTPSNWTWSTGSGRIEGALPSGGAAVDPFGDAGPGPPVLIVDVVEAGSPLDASEGRVAVDVALGNAEETAPCPGTGRSAVSYGGWAGAETTFECPRAVLRLGALHGSGADALVLYLAVTETDEDRWHVTTALETMEISR